MADRVEVESEKIISNTNLHIGWKVKITTAVAVLMSLYHIIFVSHGFDALDIYIMSVPHRSLSLAFLLALTFLVLPGRKADKGKVRWYDILLIVVGIAGPLYNFFTWDVNINQRYAFGKLNTYDLALGITTVITVLEATRRAIGIGFPIVVIAFLGYMILGSNFSGVLRVQSVTLTEVINFLVYQDSGIYGVAYGVAATVIIMFIIFSQFLFVTGAGDFFINIALSLMGHVRGGPAKVAILSSALMGTVSGSTTANIASTGTFTIPMMKRIGYAPEFAGAVETVASNGGQIMPPVMGLVAYVMAEWLGMPYWSICVAAIIPALLYYIAVFVMVDAEAAKLHLHGLPRAECPRLSKVLPQGWVFILPLALLIYLLGVMGYSPQFAALYALATLLIIGIIKWVLGASKRGGTNARAAVRSAYSTTVSGLSGGATSLIQAGMGCACAGILIGAMAVTQLGLKMADTAVAISAGNQMILLILAGFTCFILGMGMGSLAIYIMVVIVVAPALLQIGVPSLASHMFVFWFALTCFLTPPVAVGAFVAAGIANASPMKTAWRATMLGFCTFTLPFMFVYKPALLLIGASPGDIAVAVIMALIGIVLLSWGLSGYALMVTNLLQRSLLLLSGLLFIIMDWRLGLVGIAIGSVVLVWQIRSILRQRAQVKVQSEQPST